MSDYFKLHDSEDGLIQTKIHGMDQDAYVVTEDRVSNFNSYSQEFQVILTLFSISLGVALAQTPNFKGDIFIISAIITVLLFFALVWSWLKFNRAKKSIFTKTSNSSITKSGNGLWVISAIYGNEQATVDVTNKLNSLIVDNKLNIKVGNDLGGDPQRGAYKQIIVDYSFMGKKYTKKCDEYEYLKLP